MSSNNWKLNERVTLKVRETDEYGSHPSGYTAFLCVDGDAVCEITHEAALALAELAASPKGPKPVDENALAEALTKTRAEGVQHGELTMRERAAKVANDAAPVVSGEPVGEGFQTAIDIRNAIGRLPLTVSANENQPGENLVA